MNGNSVPQPQVIKSAQNPYRKYLLVVFGIGVILTVVILLRFHILDNLISKKPTPSPTLPKLILSCPVPKEYCIEAKTLTYKNNPALGFNIPAGTQITSIAEVEDSARSSSGFRQTFILSTDCYTVTYTVPKDTKIRKIDLPVFHKFQLDPCGT